MAITKATASAVAPAAKGDLVVGSATNDAAVLGVGSTDQVLTVDSSTTTGLKWAAPSSGGMTLISTTTISNNASITLSSIPQTYNHLQLVIRSFRPALDGDSLSMRFNADNTANRHRDLGYTGTNNPLTFSATQGTLVDVTDNVVTTGLVFVEIPDYTNTATWKFANVFSMAADQTTPTSVYWLKSFIMYNQTSAISSLSFFSGAGNMTAGTIYLYGVK